jgi:class 3 adenylate cyclase
MEPRIQYAKTSDGVSIAFWVLGEGEPFVTMPFMPYSRLDTDWANPGMRRWFERFGRNRMMVRYDNRGSGLSDRDVSDLSIDAMIRDLEAVVDHLGLARFALYAWGSGGPTALTFAVRCPERVSKLVLWETVANKSYIENLPRFRTILPLAESDWETFTETLAHVAMGWSEGEVAHAFAISFRKAVTQETYLRFLATTHDASEILHEVSVPTLIGHERGAHHHEIEFARELATRISSSRLVVIDVGSEGLPSEETNIALEEFLDEGKEAAAEAEPPEPGAFRTVLFTDVEGSTALTQRLGDARAREVLREHERMVREALKSHGGSEVKTMGDGFMASFSSATKALACAIAMQRAFDEWNETRRGGSRAVPTTEPIRVRIGLNAGEPIAEEDPGGRSDLFGTAVIVAARIAAKAKGAEILASDVVRQLVAGKDFLFADRGEANLKGFDEPVRLFEVRWREESE